MADNESPVRRRGGEIELNLQARNRIVRIFAFLFCILQLGIVEVHAQVNGSKVGGVAFRVDDIHPVSNWFGYAKVFDKYGYHFTFAQNLELVDDNDFYYQMINDLQATGHEMADHTPNHTMLYFSVLDTLPYSGLPGVDHISSQNVFLKYNNVIDTSLYHDQANPGGCIIDIRGGMAYSEAPGAFKDLINQGGYLWGVYIPGTGQLFSIVDLTNVWAADSNDIDTLKLYSFWGEPVAVKDTNGVWCHFIGQYNMSMSDDALNLLAERTLDLCAAHGIGRPYTFIQPGGLWPTTNSDQVKRTLGGIGYTEAASDPAVALKCYDEYDPDQVKRFGMEWGDFLEDRQDLQTIESFIADKVAKHYFVVGHSHFTDLLGGWSGYLARMDSLLAWCQVNSQHIQVKTYSEMAHLLYDIPQDPYVNIIPSLSVDLDKNGVPDGYLNSPGSSDGTIDKTDGVAADGYYSYVINRIGNICYIQGLAGLEKGSNDFNIWTKGAPGDTISVTFSMPGYSNQVYVFPAVTTNWTCYSLQQSANGVKSLTIPVNLSALSIQVACKTYMSGTVKISGMNLRKSLPVPLRIVTLPDTVAVGGELFSNQVRVASIFPADTIAFTLKSSPPWLQISSAGFLTGVIPPTVGLFPVTIVAGDQHGDVDSLVFDLHVIDADQGSIQIDSKPDTVVAPEAQYYYSVYANGSYLSDTLQYFKLAGPIWLSMSSDGILSGTAPSEASIVNLVSVLVKDQHADADTQSFSVMVHPIMPDSFSYTDSPLNHGWIADLGSGNVTVAFDSTIHAMKMVVSSTSGLDFGVDRYGRWSANTISALINTTSDFMLSLWIVDANGTSLYIQYFSGEGESSLDANNTISIHIGDAIKSGSWQSFARDLNADLRSVKWQATVRRIIGFSVKGQLQISSIVLGNIMSSPVSIKGPSYTNLFGLKQNYPNPFNPATIVEFSLDEESVVTLQVHNVLGQKIKELDLGRLNPGSYRRQLDMSRYASGVYFYRLIALGVKGHRFTSEKKMLLMR